jgi:hypothetical protein
MQTRKRAREQAGRDQVHNTYYHFDPIMESIAQFLEFQDCGAASRLNRAFANKLWVYVLRLSSRNISLNPVIHFNPFTEFWIRKYALELKNQQVEVGWHHSSFFQIDIPCLFSLRIINCSSQIRLPANLTDLRILDTRGWYTGIPHMQGVRCLEIGYAFWSDDLDTLPRSLEMLNLVTGYFSFNDIPMLPNLKSLWLRSCQMIKDVHQLRANCPMLENLFLVKSSIADIANLQVSRLVLFDDALVDISLLSNIQVQVLDLSHCPKVADFFQSRAHEKPDQVRKII